MKTMFKFAAFLLAVPLSAATHWVSASGAAAWGSCVGASDPSTYCSVATANTNADAGDVVNLKTGTYSTGIAPTHSGTLANRITFQAAPGETPTFSGGSLIAVAIIGQDYIVIKGLTATNVSRWFWIGSGADHNEISYCTFDVAAPTTVYRAGLVTNADLSFVMGDPSTNNWIHHNTFSHYGAISTCDDMGTVSIGGITGDTSAYNTFSNNVFAYGGHDAVEVASQFNTFTGNVVHNEEAYFVNGGGCTNDPASGYFGDRGLILTDLGAGTTEYNLVEGNRFGYAGTPPDDDGANGVENAGGYTIVRYNYMFGNGAAGYYSKTQDAENADYAHVFNNTIYSNGYGDAAISDLYKGGVVVDCNGTTHPASSVVKNNIIRSNYSDVFKHVGSDCSGQFTMTNNLTTDPSFINTSMTDKTSLVLPNLSIQAGSAAIDGGTYLTQANGAGTGSTTLVVDDALYFQDGTWGSDLTHGVTLFPDWIAIGTVTNTVQISSINYATNTITLASPMSWSDNASIWLYKKSDGSVVLAGSAPDYGASEYISPSSFTGTATGRINQ